MSRSKKERQLILYSTSRSTITGALTLFLTDVDEEDRQQRLVLTSEEAEGLARFISNSTYTTKEATE